VRRHEIDAVSVFAGLLFVVVAGVHIVARATDRDLSLRWTVPAVLVVLGTLGLLSAVRSPRPDRGVTEKPAEVDTDAEAENAEAENETATDEVDADGAAEDGAEAPSQS
jgi:hypothetical protein